MHNIPACLMRAAKFTFARCFCIRYYEAEYSVYPIVHRWPRLVNAGPSIIASSFVFIESCANFQNGVKQPRATSFISSRNLHRYRPLIASSCAAPLHRIKFAISRDLLTRFLPYSPPLSPSFPFLPAYRFWDGKRLRKTDLEGLNSIRSKHSREDRAQFNRARLPTIYPRYL